MRNGGESGLEQKRGRLPGAGSEAAAQNGVFAPRLRMQKLTHSPKSPQSLKFRSSERFQRKSMQQIRFIPNVKKYKKYIGT
jgi:hypothetical protein